MSASGSREIKVAAPGAGDRFDAIVVGGGPAGLAAAWEIAIAGRRVLVLERERVLGGLCATDERDGFRFDLGGHRIISKRHDLVDRIRELMGDELIERERRSVIVLDARTRLGYPLVARELIERLPAATLGRALIDYASRRVEAHWHPRPDVTFRDWVVSRFGETLYDLFFGPYTEKLWGLPATELSADWAAQRISLLNLGDVGLRLLGLRHGGARTYARRYLYPRGGIGRLFERLVTRLHGLGVVIETETRVEGVVRGADGRVTALRTVSPRGRRTISCDAVITSAPLESSSALLSEQVPATARLQHRGLRFLNVMMRGGPCLDATWAYVPSASFTMTRIQEPAQRSPDMVPPGHASLMFEIPADPGDARWCERDEVLFARIATEAMTLGFDMRERTVGYFSSFAAHAYPLYRVGYRQTRDELLARVAEAKNVWTVGRQGLFRYVFMDTAMEMGFTAAREWLGGLHADPHRTLAIDNNPTLHEIESVAA